MHLPPRHRRLRRGLVGLALGVIAPLTAVAVHDHDRAGEFQASVPPGASAPVQAAVLPPVPAVLPSFGAQFHGLWTDYTPAERRVVLDRLVELGATWVRLDVSWAMLQPVRGSYDRAWGVPFIDQVIRMARDRGLKVLVTFWRTPAWANSGRGEVAEPDDPGDYARALGWAVGHWKGEVRHWEVWNEPNLDTYFTSADPATYVRLLCAAYPTVKAANPAAEVVFGGTMYSDDGWIGRAYDAGAGGCFDIMAVHPYVAPGNVSPRDPARSEIWNFRHIKAVHRVMQEHGDGRKKIWATEFGWSSHDNVPGAANEDLGVTQVQQAAYAVSALKLLQHRFPYVTRVFWYNEHDLATGSVQHDHYGLLSADLAPKEVFYVLRDFLHTRS